MTGNEDSKKRLSGCSGGIGGGGGGGCKGAGLPLMLTCRAKQLQTMPYAMAADAVDAPLYLSETRTMRDKQPLPCLAVDGAEGDAGEGASWPIYLDSPAARVRLPREVALPGVQRVHLLTASSDATVEESFRDGLKGGAAATFVSFVPSRDCRCVARYCKFCDFVSCAGYIQ